MKTNTSTNIIIEMENMMTTTIVIHGEGEDFSMTCFTIKR